MSSLKYWRHVRGLTQEELSKISGVSQNSISCFEVGTFQPRLEIAFKLSLALNVPVTELFKELYSLSSKYVVDAKQKFEEEKEKKLNEENVSIQY